MAFTKSETEAQAYLKYLESDFLLIVCKYESDCKCKICEDNKKGFLILAELEGKEYTIIFNLN